MWTTWALALLGLSTLVFATGTQCYYPDSSPAMDWNYENCTGGQYSSCCIQQGRERDICLGNGLCWFDAPDNHLSYIFRGACTDRSWTRPECSQYCYTDLGNTWEALIWCNATQQFCCARSAESQNDTNCCHHEQYMFTLPDLPSWLMANLTEQPSNSSGLSRPDSSSTGSITSSPTSVASTTTLDSSATPQSSASHAMPTTTWVAIILGVTLSLVLLAVVGFYLYRRRKRRSTPRESIASTIPIMQSTHSPPTSDLEVIHSPRTSLIRNSNHHDSTTPTSQLSPSATLTMDTTGNGELAAEREAAQLPATIPAELHGSTR